LTDLVGQTIGHYHILEQLGEGGMAVVYKAYDTRLERHVAFKIILPQKQHTEKFIKRFDREAKALAALSNPNIVKIIDYGEHDGLPYLIMEYLHGGTLKQKLMGKPVPWTDAIQVLIPIARALDYAHERKVVHRDIKPSNILITETGDPMVSDFGIAKILEAEETLDLTETGVGVGTPEYMSVEQAQGKAVDGRSDIYSLGVVFYEMVTGRKPYQADTPLAVIFKLASEPLPRPTQFASSLPESVEGVLLKMLARSPEDRYQNCGALVQALEKLLADGEALAETKQHQASKSKRPVLLTIGFGLLLLVVISAIQLARMFAFQNGSASTQIPLATSSLTVASSATKADCGDPGACPTATSDVAIASTNTYLIDIKPVEARAEKDYLGYGVFPWSEGPMTKGENIFIKGRYYDHSIFAHAVSSLKYELGGRYEKLETQVYYFGPCNPEVDGAIFRIFADDQLVYESPALSYGDKPLPVEVSLAGVDQILLTTDPLSNSSCDWTIWLEPILVPSLASPTRIDLFDDFQNSRFDGTFDREKWLAAGNCTSVAQQNGSLVFKNQDSGCDLSVYAGDSQYTEFTDKSWLESKIRLEDDFAGDTVTQELQFMTEDLPGNSYWILCGLIQNRDGIRLFFSITDWGMNKDAEYSQEMPAKSGQWYDVRLAIDPETMKVSCTANDQILGAHVPSDAHLLKSARFKRVIEAARFANSFVTSAIDDVSIPPVPRP
jgi:serine/threonine protein kinase